MMVQPASNPDAKGPHKGRKELAPEYQEELHLFLENQYICLPLINIALKNLALKKLNPWWEVDLWTKFPLLHSLAIE